MIIISFFFSTEHNLVSFNWAPFCWR